MATEQYTPSLFPEGRRVKVLLPLPLAGAYDYAVPEGMDPHRETSFPCRLAIRCGLAWSGMSRKSLKGNRSLPPA